MLDNTSGPALLAELDCLLFDCDGVLWRGNEAIPRAVEALHVFRAAGKRLLFVTNNSSKSRAQYVAKFQGLGLDVRAEEIVSSSYTAAAYLASIGFGQRLHPGKRVLLLGSAGMAEELSAAGLSVLDAAELRLPVLESVDAMLATQLDPSIGAVLLGWDARFDYARLSYAAWALRELQDVVFVATNLDHADFIGAGRMMPGTGCLVAALEMAAVRPAVNVGKGGAWLFPHLMSLHGLDPGRTAVIGDRLDTDIALGKQGGMRTLLPLTGVTTLEEARAAPPGQAPDYVMPSVAALGGCL